MVDLLVAQVVVLFGSTIGATAATLIPFWQKLREEQALGHELKFEKKYLGTLFFAFIVGIGGAILSFDEQSAKVDLSWTIVKIFIVSVVASATSNVTFNRLMSISKIPVELAKLKQENENLRQIILKHDREFTQAMLDKEQETGLARVSDT